MDFTKTDIEYKKPEGLSRSDQADYRYGHTEDGRFFASAELTVCSDAGACVVFHFYVELSEADWRALRDGTAKFVTGAVSEPLPRALIGEYSLFDPSGDRPYAIEASYTVGSLEFVFDALGERELDAA